MSRDTHRYVLDVIQSKLIPFSAGLSHHLVLGNKILEDGTLVPLVVYGLPRLMYPVQLGSYTLHKSVYGSVREALFVRQSNTRYAVVAGIAGVSDPTRIVRTPVKRVRFAWRGSVSYTAVQRSISSNR